MTTRQENQIIYRRFLLVTLAIALLGIALAQIIAATQPGNQGLTLHDRSQEWEQHLKQTRCGKGERLCSVTISHSNWA